MSRSRKRAPAIASSSLAGVVLATLNDCAAYCLDNEAERAVVAEALVAALLARPEAVALREAWQHSPTQATLIIAQREMLGDCEGHVLAAAARLAGLAVAP